MENPDLTNVKLDDLIKELARRANFRPDFVPPGTPGMATPGRTTELKQPGESKLDPTKPLGALVIGMLLPHPVTDGKTPTNEAGEQMDPNELAFLFISMGDLGTCLRILDAGAGRVLQAADKIAPDPAKQGPLDVETFKRMMGEEK